MDVRNEVTIVGRLARDPVRKELPSGDTLLSFTVVVEREPGRRPAAAGRRAPTVDSLECVAWSRAAQRAVGTWVPNDVVEVHGALRRRFWRGGAGVASRYEIEVVKAKRLARAA